MYNYIKALHIIFVVTWFSGLFYIVRLFIYNAEAGEKPELEQKILRRQFAVMIKKLWFVITWPSAILTLILGITVFLKGGWDKVVLAPEGRWLFIKLIFVLGLYLYHFSLQYIFSQQMKGIFRYSSQQLRIWNEMATIFLVAIVMLVVVRENMSWAWGLTGLVLFVVILMSGIKLYKLLRSK